jgi:U3 small nucleolar RNA-associated protein 18
MPASKRKRLRLARENAKSAGPLGSASAGDPDAGKDDEERELESFLFGKSFAPSNAKEKALNVESQPQPQNQSSGLEHMLDEEVSIIVH